MIQDYLSLQAYVTRGSEAEAVGEIYRASVYGINPNHSPPPTTTPLPTTPRHTTPHALTLSDNKGWAADRALFFHCVCVSYDPSTPAPNPELYWPRILQNVRSNPSCQQWCQKCSNNLSWNRMLMRLIREQSSSRTLHLSLTLHHRFRSWTPAPFQ